MQSNLNDKANSGRNEPIAVVGMSCIFPGAPSLESFWQNVVRGQDAIREAGEGEWHGEKYRSKDGFGRIYCTKGGFITEYAQFNPIEFGIMPSSIQGGDPDQYLALRAAAEALRDAGYYHKNFDAERADIIIGRTMAPGAGSLNLIQHGQTVEQFMDVLTALCPQLTVAELNSVKQKLEDGLPPCTAATIPAVMPNVLSGRIAAKLGFRGRNLVLDAACASSLIAVELCMQGLHANTADIAIAGGIHINSHPYFYQMFCELGALSTSGAIRPFDERADGTILGEGVGMIVLKRLSDAERDGNRIYAVIRGIGSSGDGRAGGSLAPNVAGEVLAMRRAFENAGVSPRTVELLEAHGTGTKVGDSVEMKAVQEVFGAAANGATRWCAVGSVKAMIGHTQAASGMAGLIKSALALHHRLLPPTLNVEHPNSQVDWEQSPCYINHSAVEWAATSRGDGLAPRRAGVSAFGFGGVNAHAVLEEFHHAGNYPPQPRLAPIAVGTVSLCLRYPELKAGPLKETTLSPGAVPNRSVATSNSVISPPPATNRGPTALRAPAPGACSPSRIACEASDRTSVAVGGNGGGESKEAVLHSFIETVSTFQRNLLQTQENVMIGYLEELPVSSKSVPSAELPSNQTDKNQNL